MILYTLYHGDEIYCTTSAYVQCMHLAGGCSVRGDCARKNDIVDLWLLTILQDLTLARYSCVIASELRIDNLSPEQGALLVGSQDAMTL